MVGAILFLMTYVSVCIFIIYSGVMDIKNGYKIEGSLLVVGGIIVVSIESEGRATAECCEAKRSTRSRGSFD